MTREGKTTVPGLQWALWEIYTSDVVKGIVSNTLSSNKGGMGTKSGNSILPYLQSGFVHCSFRMDNIASRTQYIDEESLKDDMHHE